MYYTILVCTNSFIDKKINISNSFVHKKINAHSFIDTNINTTNFCYYILLQPCLAEKPFIIDDIYLVSYDGNPYP